MAEKFIGAQIRAGEFTDKNTGKLVQYNNLVLYTTSPLKCGEMWSDKEPVKITNTAENILKVFGTSITMDFLRERLGWYVDVFYNKFKKVDKVIFYPVNPAQNEDAYKEALAFSTPIKESSVTPDDYPFDGGAVND